MFIPTIKIKLTLGKIIIVFPTNDQWYRSLACNIVQALTAVSVQSILLVKSNMSVWLRSHMIYSVFSCLPQTDKNKEATTKGVLYRQQWTFIFVPADVADEVAVAVAVNTVGMFIWWEQCRTIWSLPERWEHQTVYECTANVSGRHIYVLRVWGYWGLI